VASRGKKRVPLWFFHKVGAYNDRTFIFLLLPGSEFFMLLALNSFSFNVISIGFLFLFVGFSSI
jgi:hypothetical protein